LVERPHAKDAIVGQVQTDAEREGQPRDLAGRDEPEQQPTHGIDVIVPPVHPQVVERA